MNKPHKQQGGIPISITGIVLLLISASTSSHATPSMNEWNQMLGELSRNNSVLLKKSHTVRPSPKEAKADEEQEEALTPEEKARKEKTTDLEKNHKKYTRKLYKAVKAGDIAESREYILKKADVNYARKKGVSLLHIAAAQGNLPIVRMLVANGADVEAVTVKNWTPLHHASRFGHLEVVRFLMSKGGNMYLANTDGKNSYALAKQLQHADVINFYQIWRKYH